MISYDFELDVDHRLHTSRDRRNSKTLETKPISLACATSDEGDIALVGV